MSSLSVELYLDEDVDVLVADLLRAHGFSATSAARPSARKFDRP